MSGYNLVLKIRRLEEECNKLGFMMCHGRHHYHEYGDVVAIKPKDSDSLPIYARDAELFAGTLTDLERWIQGVIWAREYDHMLRVSNSKKRERKEQDYRNQKLKRMLMGEKVKDVDK
jgi:hypothetical protein